MLLLPDNVRIRRFNLSSAQYSDYVDNAEHIQALDYLWDPEGLGLSKALFTGYPSRISHLCFDEDAAGGSTINSTIK